MFGWGRRRWMVANAYDDPRRAYFGLGPCGEFMYRLYKEGNIDRLESWVPRAGLVLVLKKLEDLERKLEELKK